MRIISLLGLGIPVLAVSGAVAYGSIREISRSLTPAPVVQSTAGVLTQTQAQALAKPTAMALDFIVAGQTEWDVPQDAAFVVPLFEDQHIETSAPSGLDRSMPGASRQSNIDPADSRAVVTARQPESRDAVRQPRVIVTAKQRAERPRPTVPAPAKRAFKMPWQTGVFQ